jgi:outer membrane murein-binding lipoprotein Lpp
MCFRARIVPENITKKASRDAKTLAAKVDDLKKAKAARVASRAAAMKNAEKYAAEYATADSTLI